MKKEIYLVDCENVGYKNLSYDGKIFYFTSGTNFMENLKSNEKEVHVYHDGCKDALDFILDTKLGYLICHYGKAYKYRIVSMDKGYENIVRYWGSQGYNVGTIQGNLCENSVSEKGKKSFDIILKGCDVTGWSDSDIKKLGNVFRSWLKSKEKSKSVLSKEVNKAFKNLSICVRENLVDYLYKEVVD